MFQDTPYSQPIRRSRTWLYVFLFTCPIALLLIYFAAAPFLTVWDMSRAAGNRDGERFASYIDFPKFKENLKAELNASVAEKMAKDTDLQKNPFSGLGMLLAPTIINNMVDAFVTPAGIERMMSGQLTPQTANEPAPTKGSGFLQNVNYEMGYAGFNEFRVTITIEPTKETTALVFERQNLVSWRLVNLKLPKFGP